MTIYPENIIFSVNMLLTKNKEYLSEMRELAGGIQAKDIDLEKYIVETNFGNKVVPVSIVSPEIAKITLDKISTIYSRILENDAQIKFLINSQELYGLTLEEALEIATGSIGLDAANELFGTGPDPVGLEIPYVSADDFGYVSVDDFIYQPMQEDE